MPENADMISIQGVFKDYYEIPDFQREYRWTKKNAGELVEDIRECFYDENNLLKPPPGADPGTEPSVAQALKRSYFLGLMVACKQTDQDSNESFLLIDAQQRVTTLFLLFCAIRGTLIEQEENVPSLVETLLLETRTLMNGREVESFKLKPQYADDEKVLHGIYSEGAVPEELSENMQGSHKNMRDVYEFFMQFLNNHFSRADNLREFAQIVGKGVTFARIITEDTSTAITIFERINARGVDLTAIDLIKNQVFGRASDRSKSQVIKKWKYLTRDLLRDEKNPMVFFRYFVASEFTGAQMSEAKLYEWFKGSTRGRENISLIANSSEMKDTVGTLIKAAEFYAKFLRFKSPSGNAVPSMQNIPYLGGTSMKQQNFLFMGARHLNDKLFSDLAHYAENFIFHVLITKQQTNFLETQFPKWANELRSIQRNDRESFEQFIENHFVSYMNSKQEEVQDVLDKLAQGEDPIKQKYRTKYVLAKLAQHIQKHTNQSEPELQKFCRGSTYEIEQVIDAVGADGAIWASQEQLNSLGNLTLVTRDKARRVRGMSFEQKIPEYKTATLLMTRAIVSGQGNHFKPEVDPEPLQPYSSWGPDEIARRQQVLADMGMRIWGVKA
ncbi:MAG: DUF262 domain-containing protein [Gammaproteobacteria bacterium AqS3]|nr:DUF262 domain-containing protein [Gammaproteobacteria bacterium AqS3]